MESITIGEIADIYSGYAFKSKDLYDEPIGIPVIKIGNLVGSEVDYSTTQYIQKKHALNIQEKYYLKDKDILIAMTGQGSVGRVSQLRKKNPDDVLLLNQRVGRIVVDPQKADRDFIFFLLSSKYYQDYLFSAGYGSGQPNLSPDIIKNVTIPNIELNQQKKISSILSAINDKIETNKVINQNLSEQIESLLLAFIDEEDTTPVKLGDYLYIKGRIGWKGLKKSEYLDQSEYRIINGETLTKSGIDWSKAGYISKERYDESPEIMLNTGDILLSKDGTIGKIGYVDSLELPTSVASGIFVIRNNKPDIISTTFIYYLLKSRLFEAFIVARTEGSVIPHLYQKDFMEFEFPLPNQKRMAQFEEIAEPMFSQIINNLNENKRLATLRDTLLPKLMSGELDVSEIDL